MAVNKKMFQEIYEFIMQFPELHYQGSWETDPAHTGNCGTTRCIAGWATWIGARDAKLLSRKRDMTSIGIREALADRLGLREGHLDDEEYYYAYHHSDYAVLGGQLLGLTGEQAQSLFHDLSGDRVLARVKSFAETGEDIPRRTQGRLT
jgi:hypothetical protein